MSSLSLIPLPNNRNKKLWVYFGFKSSDGKTIVAEYQKKVFCRIDGCTKEELPYCGNTTNLVHHLQKFHPKENAIYLGTTTQPAASTSQAQKISTFFHAPLKQIDLDSKRGKDITSGIVSFIVEDLRPFNVVAGSGFKKLMATTAPDYPLAGDRYYAGKVSDRYAVAVARLQSILAGTKTVAITCDLWTSSAQHAYLGMTAHFVDQHWTLHARYLDCVKLPGMILFVLARLHNAF